MQDNKEIIIYTASGVERFRTAINEGAKRKMELMKEDYITLPFNVAHGIKFSMGDYCDIDLGDENGAINGRYVLRTIQKPVYNAATGGYGYNLQFDAWYYDWANKKFKYSPSHGGMEASFSLTADLSTHMSVLLDNIKFHEFTYKGTAITVSIDLSTATEAASVKLISYDKLNLIDALTRIAETFDCEWWITNNVIQLGRCHLGGDPYELSLEKNLEELTASDSKTEYFTRIIAFGSEKNIPSGYYDVPDDAVKAAVVPRRLRLPKEECPNGYYDVPGTTDADAVEGVVIFDNIYPHTSVPVTKVETYQSEIQDEEGNGTGEYETFYLCYFDHNAFPFEADDNDPEKDYRLPDTDLVMTFIPNNDKTSKLSGMSFVTQWHKPGDKVGDKTIADGEYCFEVIANENYGIKLPNATLAPAVGDTFSLTGWDSTKIASLNLIPDAEAELYDATISYSKKSQIDPHVYTCKLMSDFAYGLSPDNELNVSYWQQYELGTPILLKNGAFFDSGERLSRVIGFELNLDIPYDTPTYLVGEKSAYSRLANVENDIKEIQMNGVSYTSVGGIGGMTIYVIKSNDTTSPTDNNVYSAKRVQKDFLSKTKKDTAQKQIDFKEGLTVGKFTNTSGGALILNELGQSYGEVDRLKVRLKAYFESLEIQEVNTVGGKVVISPAGAVTLALVDEHRMITVVNDEGESEEVDNGIPEGVYRCYFLGEQEGTVLANRWQVDDQAMSKTFNVTAGTHQGVSNHYYWRLVTAVSSESTMLEKDGLKYHWIDLSKTDSDTGSDIPVAADVVAQVGNRTDVTRQNALIFSAVDIYSPSITLYHGIDNYTFLNKEYVEYGVNKSTNKAFFNVFGDAYIGDRRDGNEKEYVKYENGKLDVAGTVHIGGGSTIGGDTFEEYIKKVSPPVEQEDIEQFVNNIVNPKLEGIQDQIDGVIEAFNGFGAPTLTNFPAEDWITDEQRKAHNKDTYTDKTEYVDDVTTPTAGQSWKWQYTSPTDYGWIKIADSDATKALLEAARAQDTADGKRRVFTSQPTAQQVYDTGDLWVNATYGTQYSNDILRCVTHKDAGAAFNIEHWTPASKYTDDTKAEQALTEIGNTRKELDTLTLNVNQFKNDYDNFASDGVFTSAEVVALKEDIKYIESIFQGAKGSYDEVITNELLLDNGQDSKAKTDLSTAFTQLQAAKNELIAVVEDSVADRKVDDIEIAEVNSKYSNFNNKYNAFYQALNKAERYITDKTVNNKVKGLDGLLANLALADSTDINGGLILTSMVALRNASDPSNPINAGINGVQNAATDIATWWGGGMQDKQQPDNTFIGDGATSLIRFDGSGYFANGAIWWDKTGQLHADPLSFFVGDNYVGLNLALFQFVPNNAKKIQDVTYVIPQAPFKQLNTVDYIAIGKIKIAWDAANNALKVESTEDGKTANLYATGGVSALGMSSISGGGTGGGLIETVLSFSDITSTVPTDNVTVFNADTVKKIYDRLVQVEGGALTSVSWSIIQNKPTTLAGYGVTDAYTKVQTDSAITSKINALDVASAGGSGKYIQAISQTDGKISATEATMPTALKNPTAITIQKNGTSLGSYDGSAAKTINISDVASAATLSSHTGNTTVHITAAERTKWNKVVTDFAAITGTDTDTIINKWEEVVAFLDTYTEADTLAGLLGNKADKTITISAGTGLSGGGSLAANRTLSLAVSGVTAGTYTKVTVDAYGRVTAGATLAAADIPSLPWSKITSGKPTTLSGYGITDAYTKTDADGRYVNLTEAQTISGQKTFSSDIVFAAISNGTYPVLSKGLKWSGSTDGADICYKLEAADLGVLRLNMTDDANTKIAMSWNGTTKYDFLQTELKASGVTANFSAVKSNSIQIGSCTISWDSANNALKFDKNIYSEGGVSALGMGTVSGGSGGGLVESIYRWADLGGTFSDSANDTFNAYTINKIRADLMSADSALSNRVTSLEGGAAVNVTTTGSGNAITAISKTGNIITATKGATFLTAHQSLANYLWAQGANDFDPATMDGYYVGMTTKSGITTDWWHILSMNWGTGNTIGNKEWVSQLALPTQARRGLRYRTRNSSTAYSGWITVLDTTNTYLSGGVITINGSSITPLTAHQTIYDLTIQGNGTTIGTFDPNGAAKTINITPANIGAAAASHAHSYLPLSGGTLTGSLLFSNSGTTLRGMQGTMGDNDQWRVMGGATASNAGFLEIATSDDGNEPIYVRQFNNGVFGTLVHSITLMDGSGNQTFNTVTAAALKKSGGTSSQFLKADGSVDGNSYLTTGTASSTYVKKSGDTMTGLLTAKTSASHSGVKLGDTYLTAISGNVIFQNNSTIRFGADSWDYNVWAGLKYNSSNKYIYLGLADGTIFTANTAQSGGSILTPGISNIYVGNNTTNKVWHAGNDGSGSGLDADLLDGYHASSFSLSGHTHSYLPLAGGTMTGNITYTGKGTSYIGNGINDAANGVGGALNNLVISSWYGISFTTSCSGQIYTNTNAVSINCRTGNVYAARFNGSLTGAVTGNATSATQLQTARTIWGQSFNGTGNVSGDMTSVGHITMSGYLYSTKAGGQYSVLDYLPNGALALNYGLATHKNLPCVIFGNTGIGVTEPSYKLDVDGSVRCKEMFIRDGYEGYSWNGGYGAYNTAILNNSSQTPLMVAYRSGSTPSATGTNRLFAMELLNSGTELRFAFGGAWRYIFSKSGMFYATAITLVNNSIEWDASNKAFKFNGNLYATGGVSALGTSSTSDIRLKNRLRDVTLEIKAIAAAPSFVHTWKNKPALGEFAGTSAQYWQSVLPQVVSGSKWLALDYGKTALLSAIALAKRSESHEQRIRALEMENRNLRRELETLKFNNRKAG